MNEKKSFKCIYIHDTLQIGISTMEKFMLCFSLLLAGIIPNSEPFAIKQEKFLIALFEDLNIKNVIIIRKHISDSKINDFNLIKKFTEKNIYADYMTIKEMREILEEQTWKYEPKTFILFDDDEIFNEMPTIFKEGYSKFVRLGIWAIFHNHEFDIKNLENQIYIPYDCQFFVIKPDENDIYQIFEYFDMKINDRNFYVKEFGDWNENNGLTVPLRDFYQRRFDMNQTKMEMQYKDVYPYGCEDVANCVFLKEVKDDMARMMNFRPDVYDVIPGLYKFSLFSAMIDEIFFEIKTDAIFLQPETSLKDAIGPLWKVPAFCYVKFSKSYEEGDVAPHVRPFSDDTWAAIIAWIIVSSFCILYVDYLSATRTKQEFRFTDSLFRQFESSTNQCGGEIPETISSRLATVVTRGLFTALLSFYSAVFLSFLYVRKIYFPFTDLQGLIDDGSFTVSFQSNWFLTDYFYKTALRGMIRGSSLPRDENETMQAICADPKYAFVTFNSSFFDDVNELETCRLMKIPKPVDFVWVAVTARDDSCYTKIFNRILKSFRSAGVLKKLEKVAIGTSAKVFLDEEYMEPVEFNSLLVLFLTAGSMYLFALLIFVFEVVWFLIKKMKKK